MLFKFKSKATADLIMLEADARRLLKIMIGDDPVKGIVSCHALPEVLARIDAAVLQDEALRQAHSLHVAKPDSGKDSEPALPTVRLAQRAAPMQQMVQRCMTEKSDIVWGV